MDLVRIRDMDLSEIHEVIASFETRGRHVGWYLAAENASKYSFHGHAFVVEDWMRWSNKEGELWMDILCSSFYETPILGEQGFIVDEKACLYEMLEASGGIEEFRYSDELKQLIKERYEKEKNDID